MSTYHDLICRTFGNDTTQRKANMAAFLMRKHGADWRDDVDASDLAEEVITQALTPDQYDNMSVDAAEELQQWVCDNFFDL